MDAKFVFIYCFVLTTVTGNETANTVLMGKAYVYNEEESSDVRLPFLFYPPKLSL